MKLKKLLASILCVAMVLSTMSFTVFADEVYDNRFDSFGLSDPADTAESYLRMDMYEINAKESLEIQLWSEDTQLSSTTWAQDYPVDTGLNKYLSCAVMIKGTSGFWNTNWIVDPSYKNVPTKAVLVVDGVTANEMVFADVKALKDVVNPDSWVALEGVAKAPTGELQYAGYVTASAWRDWIAYEPYNVYAEKSIEIELWSGENHLSTTTYTGSFPKDSTGAYMTACVAVKGGFFSWDTEWHIAPTVNNIPDCVKLVVDGQVLDTLDKVFINDSYKNAYIALEGVGAAAKIGDVKYGSLEEALSKAEIGDTIKVLTAEEGKNNEVTKTSDEGFELGESEVITTDIDEGIEVTVPELVSLAVNNYDGTQATYGVVVENNGTAYDESAATLNLDISLVCTYNGVTEDAETNGQTFTVKVKLPANADPNGTVTVLHNGNQVSGVEVIDGYIVFETDGFSPYTIGYQLLGASAPAAMCEAAAVKFVVSEENENNTVYDIVIESTDGNEIFGLVSAQMDIKEAADMSGVNFLVEGANDFIVTDDEDSYMFTLKSADNQALADTKSGTSVKVGKLTISGFTTDAYTVNAVIGTDDGAATSYLDTNETKNIHIALANGTVDYVKAVPTQELTIEVTFPKAISDNDFNYQDMKITVTEQDLGKVAEFKLGKNGAATIADNKYTVSADLQKYKTYTVKIEGAGYRTFTKTVDLDADKTMIVWNNYKDNGALIMKNGETTPEATATITFLAGDIVKDNTVNAYDLSVLLSYAFTDGIDTTAASKFAQYDLNRDGLINYKDAAMILDTYVWGK